MDQTPHTVVLSDIHLSDPEPTHTVNPLWKRYKRPKLFVDRSFDRFLQKITEKTTAPIELVLNGDIFDFDSVMAIPPKRRPFRVSWLEQVRGLNAEQSKSRYKLSIILDSHPVWVEALRKFILAGNRVIFVIGNHDMELQWPSVQSDLIHYLNLPLELKANVTFCEWFYISNQDTLIEHGNQYDPYCICTDPIHPVIRISGRPRIRLPFGNLAARYLTNGMGLINPHVESTFIMSGKQYVLHFYRYVLRVQPLIIWTWFWSAIVTLVMALREGLLPALKDPLTVESRVEQIAKKSNASPYMVRALRELHAHPAHFYPLMLLRELWLDRALLLAAIFLISFQFFSFINVFVTVSFAWFYVPFLVLLPLLIFYSKSIKSEVAKAHTRAIKSVVLSSQIARVSRVIFGHSHIEIHGKYKGVEILNTGTWSPAYKDPECTEPFGRKCFAWLRPKEDGLGRIAELFEWTGDEMVRIDPSPVQLPQGKSHQGLGRKIDLFLRKRA